MSTIVSGMTALKPTPCMRPEGEKPTEGRRESHGGAKDPENDETAMPEANAGHKDRQ